MGKWCTSYVFVRFWLRSFFRKTRLECTSPLRLVLNCWVPCWFLHCFRIYLWTFHIHEFSLLKRSFTHQLAILPQFRALTEFLLSILPCKMPPQPNAFLPIHVSCHQWTSPCRSFHHPTNRFLFHSVYRLYISLHIFLFHMAIIHTHTESHFWTVPSRWCRCSIGIFHLLLVFHCRTVLPTCPHWWKIYIPLPCLYPIFTSPSESDVLVWILPSPQAY